MKGWTSMPNTDQIIINKAYFDNIKTAIDSINSFVESGFKNKNFPIVDADYQLDGTIMTILSWLNNVEPTWIDAPDKAESAVESILDATEDMEGDIYTQLTNDNNTAVLDRINAFIGFKALQMIADHFTEFSNLINGIYTFEIFTNPTKYKNAIEVFSQPIPLSEIEDVLGDGKYTLFDETKYVTGIFNNDQIELPKNLKLDAEITRFTNLSDLSGFEVVVDDSVQEAAEVNMFTDTKPAHIKYNPSNDKFIISSQFNKAVDKLVKALNGCDSTDDLVKLFGDLRPNQVPEADSFTSVVIPYILARVYSNPRKNPNENYNKDAMNKYTKSYDSIINKNLGAKRFKNYDLFSTFKADKEGTIKFIEDFLKLNLVNDKQCVIKNNTLLTLFNIFDSRIYLDILYNMIPNDIKKKKYSSEDEFVKSIRARINKNSRVANVYKPDAAPAKGDQTPTSNKMMEYATIGISELGDMSITDMQYCEQYSAMMMAEIQCVPDAMYNVGTSQIAIDQYIGESYNVFNEGFLSNIFKKRKDKKVADYIKIIEDITGSTLPAKFINFIEKYHLMGGGVRYKEYELSTVYSMKEISNTIKRGDGLEGDGKEKVLPFAECFHDSVVDHTSKNLKCFYFDTETGEVSVDKTYFSDHVTRERLKKNVVEKSIDKFINKLTIDGEPVSIQEAYVLEQEKGDIPDYIKKRMDVSDESGDKPKTTITDVNLPPDTPANSVDELADSIDARMSADGGLDDVLGAGYNNNPNKNNQEGKVVYNITYNNSFNKNSNNTNTNSHNDSSTGKTITTTNTTTHTNSHNDSSQNKSLRNTSTRNRPNNNIPNDKGINNNNNSKNPLDTKDTKDDVMLNEGYQMFSSGYTINDVFAFLESEEPQSGGGNAGDPPGEDLLTKAMDRDRKKLSKQQKAKQTVQKGINLSKALLKPAARTKQWLTDMVNTLIKNDEDKVKAEIIENHSFRMALYKAMRLGLKLGMTTVCFTINAYLGAAYLVVQGSKIADRERLKKEVHSEFMTEIQILDDKIKRAQYDDTPESRKAAWKMMRLRNKMMDIVSDTTHSTFKHPKNV